MTDKKLKVNSAAYTELSIQIAVLQASVDKLLELAIKNQQNQFTIINPTVQGATRVYPIPEEWKEVPPQWPNESRTDYMKRIGQYNEAQSDDDYYGEVYK